MRSTPQSEFVYDNTPGALRRVWRFVDTLPGNLVASLDKETNVMLIAKPIFDQLPKHQKEVIYKSQDDVEAFSKVLDSPGSVW